MLQLEREKRGAELPQCSGAEWMREVLRFVEPGHHQSHLGDAVMAINYRFNCTFNRTINCCQRQNSHHIAPHRATPHRTAPARHVRPRMRMRTRTARPAGRPAAPRRASASASATATATASARPGETSERVRACGSPSSSYRLHKWCTRSPPFKSVEILLNSRYGIKH